MEHGGDRQPPAAEPVRPGALSALLAEMVRSDPPQSPSAWDETLQRGAVVGRFELIREIGRGGFGVVWEARDRTLGRTVAFKALTGSGRPDAGEERFLREADLAARLSHPNIVTLYDVGRTDGGPYLVLELLRGRTLAQRLAHGPMSVAEAVRICVEIAKGLAHAHAHGVVHRDLTPGNVFLCDDGQVKVLDLGMAHAFGHRKLDGGTPAYMAPEQSRGAPEDERSDVYALGVLLYRMLTNELPTDRRQRRLRLSRSHGALDVPEAPALGTIVERMLQPDPVQRPREAGEVLDGLVAIQGELHRTPSGSHATNVRPTRRSWRQTALAGCVVFVVATLAFAAISWNARRGEPAPTASIAVLPFADLSPGHDQDFFAEGLAEEILTALGRMSGLRVPGRTSSFSFAGTSTDLRTIGRKLDVATVLDGSVRRAGNRVRVSARIVRTTDEQHLWSQTFDREVTDIFAVQDEIARAVVDALRVQLAPGATHATRTTSPEAYTEYLRGRHLSAQVLVTRSSDAAVASYRRAIALDPTFAPAWAWLAGELKYSRESAAEALAAADEAVSLDPTLPDAHVERGLARAILQWDWSGAQADIDRAVALGPGRVEVVRARAFLAAMRGETVESLAATRRAAELDPLSPVSWGALATVHWNLGEVAEARTALQRLHEISSSADETCAADGLQLLMEGRPAEALRSYERCPDAGDRLAGLAMAQHDLGNVQARDDALERQAAATGSSRPVQIAATLAWCRQADRAFEWLERAYARRDVELSFIRTEPAISRLRDDARYGELMRKLGLPP